MSQYLEKIISAKEELIRELDEVYALIDTSRQALKYQASCEASCVEDVLSLTTVKLFDQIETEKETLETLQAKQQGGES